MKTNILILNWKSPGAMRRCLEALSRSDSKDFRIIVISNYSSDQDRDEIRALVGASRGNLDIHLVETGSNLGYAGGNNAGFAYLARHGLAGDVLLLNPDVTVSANTLGKMTKALVGDVGVVNVRTASPDGRILYDAFKLRGFFSQPVIATEDVVTTDIAQGSCMLVRRDVAEDVRLFDERFFLYWEEVDLSLRIKAHGFKLVSITTSTVVRERNSDDRLPVAIYFSVRNARLIRQKHPAIFTARAYWIYLLHMGLISMKLIRHPRLYSSAVRALWFGYWDSRHGRFHAGRVAEFGAGRP